MNARHKTDAIFNVTVKLSAFLIPNYHIWFVTFPFPTWPKFSDLRKFCSQTPSKQPSVTSCLFLSPFEVKRKKKTSCLCSLEWSLAHHFNQLPKWISALSSSEVLIHKMGNKMKVYFLLFLVCPSIYLLPSWSLCSFSI